MSMSADDFFDELHHVDQEIPEGILRDQWGRPLIFPPGETKAVPYTRVSTMANYLDNKSGLTVWKNRMITLGMGLDEDTAAMAAALPPLTGDKKKDGPTNALLDEYAETAMRAAGAHRKREWGTAVHGFTETGQEGHPHVPARMQSDVDSYWARVREYNMRLVASEVFLVNDELRCAGTVDDLYYCYLYGLIVGDKKTGRENVRSVIMQMAIYANSMVYNPETGERTSLQSLAEGQGFTKIPPLNLKAAFYIHIPKGEGRTEFIEANIEEGYRRARVAAEVRDMNTQKDGLVRDVHDELVAAANTEAAWEALRSATTMAELGGIANHFHELGVWTERMTAFGRERMAAGEIK